MKQTRLQSAAETATNYIIGYMLAWFIMNYVLRGLGYPITTGQSGGVVAIFTVVSVIRSFAVRRFFNWFNDRPKIKRTTLIHPYDRNQYRD